ncbi:MAG TPA: hypothetical protein VNM87_05560 [Candidatus Udaeobacter sp.]|nr:hypothetical protein [Candidatus Udaeobacter sp.]
MRIQSLLLFLAIASLALVGCDQGSPLTGTSPEGSLATLGHPQELPEFVSAIDNPLLPLIPGTVFTYRGTRDDQIEINRVHVTHRIKVILGVDCTVVEDSSYVDGTLHEATLDWYAQDEDGNVWYFGEDTKEFEPGQPPNTEGSWEAGVDGAEAGIAMEADPKVGDSYRQEFLRGVAEDRAKVESLDDAVEVPYGSFTDCLRTKESTRLEPGVRENKWYARNVGFLKAVTIHGGDDVSELVDVSQE